MGEKSIRKLLGQLHQEIGALDEGDERVRTQLLPLVKDIEHQLSNLDDSVSRAYLVKGLRNLIEEFEVEHPRITAISNDIMVMLGGLGL